MSKFSDYDNHAKEWFRCLNDPEKRPVAETWLREDTVDAWRHRRMRRQIIPLIQSNAESTWLTVGDGRFGTDAHFIMQNNAKCHASDMTSPLLKIASEKGFIGEYSAQNAERLSFDDNSFDFVYCKESYHHFPRPWLAVYEMFRVARQGIILQEPNDNQGIQISIKTMYRKILDILSMKSAKKLNNGHAFEEVGNYVYKLNLYECEKFLLGMHYRWIAWQKFNDFYEKGVEFCPIEGGSDKERALRKRVKTAIRRKDIACRYSFRAYDLISVILFKEVPSRALIEKLSNTGWSIKQLPKNPFR